MTLALVALGSNLGDRAAHMGHGLRRLGELPGTQVTAVSALYETAPVGGPDNQGPYLNAAARLETPLSPGDLLAALHRIEAERERERIVRWGPRTLDLDLLTHGETVSEDPALTLPHPRLPVRGFVLVPVCDVAPDLVHPVLGRSMADLRADLSIAPDDLSEVDRAWGPARPANPE
jgi:2-amino-4-hydroxy-6-hydroxymethyldihydropteridine diphosphokinase